MPWAIGHLGAEMGDLYDGMACVSELLNKEKVLKAVFAGWNLSEPGCLPVNARGDAHGQNATPVQCIIVFISCVHASGFIIQTFESVRAQRRWK